MNSKMSIDTKLFNACKNGDEEFVNSLLNIDWNKGLLGACFGGHIRLVKLAIKQGATDYNGGLRNACMSGHSDIVYFMLDKGANSYNNGLSEACYSGHIKLVELMISKGANTFNDGLVRASEKYHKEISKLMIVKGADINNCSMLLNEEDLLYLIKQGVSQFGTYNNDIKRIKTNELNKLNHIKKQYEEKVKEYSVLEQLQI